MQEKAARHRNLGGFKMNSDHPDGLVLPPRHLAHPVVRLGFFTWTSIPMFRKNERFIKVLCVMCKKRYIETFPVNFAALKTHLEEAHGIDVDREMQETEVLTSTSKTGIKIGSSLAQVDRFNGNSVARPLGSWSMSEHGCISYFQRPPGKYCVSLDVEEYTRLLLKMLLSNNLPFSLVESDSFKQFVLFLRNEVPDISRVTLRQKLDEVFKVELHFLRQKFAENTGSFALTMVEWNSGKNNNFLGITLHFYNNSFQLESYTIGFESLHRKLALTGEELNMYGYLMDVLKDLGIDKRIFSITRDNSSTMNDAMKLFSDGLSDQGITFDGDIPCVANILNLSIDVFLKNTFFRMNRSDTFEQSLQDTLEEHPQFEQFARRMKFLPHKIRSILVQIRFNPQMRNSFKSLIKEKTTQQSTNRDADQLLRDSDTRWLSTHHMIDRFLFFREEIAKVLKLPRDESNTYFKDHEIIEEDWLYLEKVREILETFRLSTVKLQASSYPTINETIPVIYGLIKSFNSAHVTKACEENPFISKGVAEARKTILQYYPICGESISENKMLYLAIVLDPRYKLAIFDYIRGLKNKIDAIKDSFHEMYEVYERKMAKDSVKVSDSMVPAVSGPSNPPDDEFSFIGRYENKDQGHEIERYLREPREPGSQDIIAFYKSRRTMFPVISNMARDVFAACATTAPSKSLFSSIGDIVTQKRNRLSPGTIKIIAFLKSRGIINSEDCSDDVLDFEEGAISASTPITEEDEDVTVFDESFLLIDDDYDDDDADMADIWDHLIN
ncbi:hypothetical protein OXX79_000035 [Metschnikowia pulcherrima]